jgi:thioredoxin reductase
MYQEHRKQFDFIIAGGGLAGLSLAYYLSQSSLENAKILIIDQSEKKENDKTWCFWEAQPMLLTKLSDRNGMVFGFMEAEILVNFCPLTNTNIS